MATVGRIPVPGAELIYDEQGSGEPLVLVPGTGAQASSWGTAVDDLANAGYRVIAYDPRGRGRSKHPAVRDYRVHVSDLATVIEHLGVRAHLLGWSSGGSTALALAVRRPDLCRSLVIVEAPWHGLRNATPDLLATVGRAKLAELRGRHREGAALFFRWVSGRRDGRNGFDAVPAVEQEALLANSRTVLAELDPHPFGVLMEHVLTTRLASIPVPITWLLGTHTRTELFRRSHASAARRAPRIRTGHISGAGHFAHIDAPKDFALAVLRGMPPQR